MSRNLLLTDENEAIIGDKICLIENSHLCVTSSNENIETANPRGNWFQNIETNLSLDQMKNANNTKSLWQKELT